MGKNLTCAYVGGYDLFCRSPVLSVTNLRTAMITLRRTLDLGVCREVVKRFSFVLVTIIMVKSFLKVLHKYPSSTIAGGGARTALWKL